MNLVLILISAFLALGAALNAGGPKHAGATWAAAESTEAAAPAPTATSTPAPAPYDIISGGGPT